MRHGREKYQKWMGILALMLLLALVGFVVAGCSGGTTEEGKGEEVSAEKAGEESSGEAGGAGEHEGRALTEQEKAQEDKVADESDASTLYTYNCGPCHGHDGGGVVGPSIRGTKLTIEQIQKKIEVGGKEMPAFKGGELSDSQIKDIAEFVKAEIK